MAAVVTPTAPSTLPPIETTCVSICRPINKEIVAKINVTTLCKGFAVTFEMALDLRKVKRRASTPESSITMMIAETSKASDSIPLV